MKGTKTLVKKAKVTDQKLKTFVQEIVNAADRQVDGSDDYLPRKYREFFPTRDRDIQIIADAFARMRNPNQPGRNNPFFQKEASEVLCRAVIGELRNRLRAVWLAEYDDVAEWRLCVLQLHMHGVTNAEDPRRRQLYPPSPDTPIELAIDWVQRNVFMLRTCRNSECAKPFFIAEAAQERFCSDRCVAIAQKAHKRKWWKDKRGSQLYKQDSDENHRGGEKIHKSLVSPTVIADAAAQQPTEPGVNKKPGAKISVRPTLPVQGRESETTLKRFLLWVVNAQDNQVDYVRSVYPRFFPSKTMLERQAAHAGFSPEGQRTIKEQEKRRVFEQLREGLQRIWTADDPDTARWRLFTLQDELYLQTDPEVYGSDEESQPPPVDRPLHQAIALLRRNLQMLRTCSNAACKTHPFFIAGKSSQRYCSVLCTTMAQQEFKSRWWKERGSQWRKSRRAKKKKSSKSARQKH
jgi:hypothetical protein